MSRYDPFYSRRERRRKHIQVGLAVLALVLAVCLVVFSGPIVERLTPDAGADVSRETSAPEESVEWPSPEALPSDPEPTQEGSSPLPGEVDRTDPESVAEAFALMTVSWDTPEDLNESPAVERAAQAFGAPELVVPPAPAGEAAGWVQHSTRGAYTTAEAMAVPLDHHLTEGAVFPPTGEPVHPASVHVTYRWSGTGPDGQPWPDQTREVLLSLVERQGEWVVVEYGYR